MPFLGVRPMSLVATGLVCVAVVRVGYEELEGALIPALHADVERAGPLGPAAFRHRAVPGPWYVHRLRAHVVHCILVDRVRGALHRVGQVGVGISVEGPELDDGLLHVGWHHHPIVEIRVFIYVPWGPHAECQILRGRMELRQSRHDQQGRRHGGSAFSPFHQERLSRQLPDAGCLASRALGRHARVAAAPRIPQDPRLHLG